MAGFTLPEKSGEASFHADYPVFIIVDVHTDPLRPSLGTRKYESVVYIPVYTTEAEAGRAIVNMGLSRCAVLPIPDAAIMQRVLANPQGMNEATHVVIDSTLHDIVGCPIRTVGEFIAAIGGN